MSRLQKKIFYGLQAALPAIKTADLKMKSLSSFLSIIFFVVGLVLLVFLAQKVGTDKITLALKNLGSGKVLLIFIFPLSWYFLQSLAWYRILRDDKIPVSFLHIFLSKLTGEALNTITPVGFMGGDPYRIYLLQKKTTKTLSTSSVVVDRSMQTLAVITLLVITSAIAMLDLPLNPQMKITLPILSVIFLLFLLLMLHSQKQGVFKRFLRIAHGLHIKRKKLEEISHKLEKIDRQISQFYQKHPLHFYEIFVLHLAGRLLGPVEIWLMAWLMDFPIGLLPSLYLAALTIVINIVFVFIPGSIGVMEGGYGYLFHLLRFDAAHGVTLQLVRRIRALFYVLVGLFIILFYRPKKIQVISAA